MPDQRIRSGPGCEGEQVNRWTGRLRRIWIGAAALGGIALVFLIGAFLLRSPPAPVPLEHARRDFDQSVAHGEGSGVPPGVYRAEGRGEGVLDRPPTNQRDGSVMPVTVQATGPGCSSWRIEYNTSHSQGLELCRQGDSVSVVARSNFQAFDFGVATVSNRSEFRCDPPIVVAGALSGSRPGRVRCHGNDTALGGDVTTDLDVEHLGSTELQVGGRTVRVEQQRWTQELVGEQSGTLVEEWWFEPSSGMPLRSTRRYDLVTSTPLGRVGYRESGTWTLTSLSPT